MKRFLPLESFLNLLGFSDDKKANMEQMTAVQGNHYVSLMKVEYLSSS